LALPTGAGQSLGSAASRRLPLGRGSVARVYLSRRGDRGSDGV